MTIFPHPDDETVASGGLLLVAHQLGWQTVALVLTGGEAGKIFAIGFKKTHEEIKKIREVEMEKAAGILRISDLVMLDLGDGKLKEKEIETEIEIEKMINKYQPGIVLTYDHSGISGHPDHIISSLVVKKILEEKEKRKEETPLLFWATLPKSLLVYRKIFPQVLSYISSPNTVLNYGGKWLKKYLAAKAHRSQRIGRNYPLPYWLVLLLLRKEWYHQVELGKRYPYKFVCFPFQR